MLAYSFLISLLVVGSLGNSLYHAILRQQKEEFNLCNRDMYVKELQLNSTNANKQHIYQSENKCCGWNGNDDYLDNVKKTLRAPISCCVNQADCLKSVNNQMNETISNATLLFQESCSSKLLANNIIWKGSLYGMLTFFAVLTFASIWLTLYLAYAPKKKSKGPAFRHTNRGNFSDI